MAKVIITMKVMPESPDIDLGDLREQIERKINSFAGKGEKRFKEDPIGFGLVALNVIFVMDEKGESTDKLEEELKKIDGIGSVEVIDMRRALG